MACRIGRQSPACPLDPRSADAADRRWRPIRHVRGIAQFAGVLRRAEHHHDGEIVDDVVEVMLLVGRNVEARTWPYVDGLPAPVNLARPRTTRYTSSSK